MDAITMPSTLSLLPKLEKDYPQLVFAPGERFAWSPDAQTVFYDKSDLTNTSLLLHELAHGLLGHHDYSKDIELITMETEAWDKALELATRYSVDITDETVQDTLDTYREWLHARSTCPECEATGYQSGKSEYTCVACAHAWRVNEARICALRRYSAR
jgi:hypothetical protein